MLIGRRSLISFALAQNPGRLVSLTPGLIYMNAANIAPCLTAAAEAQSRMLADFHSNPAFQNREKYKPLSESVRSRLASLLGASPDEIAILRNTSEGNNLIAQGVALKPGDEVLLTEHNHPSNFESWRLRSRLAGAGVKTMPVPILARTPAEVFDSVARGVTAKTRVIALSHFTNTTGLLYPVAELARLARQRGIWLHVDGAQTFGWMRLRLNELGADSYTGSFHKWAMGPLEAGVLYVRRESLDQINPAILSVNYWSEAPGGARKFELLGQRADPTLAAIEETLRFHESVGAAELERRTLAIATRLRTALAAVPHLELRSSGEPAVCGPVIKVLPKGRDLKPIYDGLWSRHRLAIAMTAAGEGSGLRFSPHIYNSESEIDAVVAALKSYS
jgi:selenocysteine lyase/cysteine desulfurase